MIEQTEQEEMKIIVFQLKDKEYALPVNHVKAIEKILHITRVPKTVPFIKGVINLRGVIIPIIDLRIRFEIDEQVYTEQTRIIIVTLDEMDVGLIVDSANDVIDIFMENIEPQPDVVGSVADEFISGVVKLDKRLLILLNLEKVLNPEETLLSVKEG